MSAVNTRRSILTSRPAALLLAFCALHGVEAASSSPCVYWTGPAEQTAAALKSAGLTRVCVPPDRAQSWRDAGFDASALDAAELAARQPLEGPGVSAQVTRVSATRSPWIDANGWRFLRSPNERFRYEDVRPGRGALAVAEAFAYGADAVLQIDSSDVQAVGSMLAFLSALPAERLPPVADFGVVDDGSAAMGEVLNLLTRRNLLFRIVSAPAAEFPINIALGTPEYPEAEAADPSAFALKVRRQLTDERRSLRVYGTEVVICRLTGDGTRRQLQLLNYGGREITGVRIRVRGAYRATEAQVNDLGRVPLEDLVVTDGGTEFSIPRLTTYGVVELTAAM